MRFITMADTGSQVALSMGEPCEVVLAGNPTTGYQWEVINLDTSVVKQIGTAKYEPSGTAMGSSGQFIFQFQAIALGQTPLQLAYHRSFEKATPPVQAFEVTLIVRS